ILTSLVAYDALTPLYDIAAAVIAGRPGSDALFRSIAITFSNSDYEFESGLPRFWPLDRELMDLLTGKWRDRLLCTAEALSSELNQPSYTITAVIPPFACPGTVIRIQGTNFGTAPADA